MLWRFSVAFIFLILLGCNQPFTQTNSNNDKNASVGARSSVISPKATSFDQVLFDNSSLAWGGLMWDKWWTLNETGELNTTPVVNREHPLWFSENASISGLTTWRCQQCHGWDYLGRAGEYGPGNPNFTNIKGILPTATDKLKFTTPAEIFAFLDNGTVKSTTDHAFSSYLSSQALHALTKFIWTIQQEASVNISPNNFIDNSSPLAVQGNLTAGREAYNAPTNALGCVECHGATGKAIDLNTPQNLFLTTVAWTDPLLFLHKVRFGHPGATPTMPGLVTSITPQTQTLQTAVNVLRYAQQELTPTPAGFDAARIYNPASSGSDVARGGILYDTWWAAIDETAPVASPNLGTHVLYPAASTIAGDNTWRCQQCHGWDYLGVDGAYGDTTNVNYTSFNGLVATPDQTTLPVRTVAADIFDFIANGQVRASGDHSFTGMISDADINALTQFIITIQKEALEMQGPGSLLEPWTTTNAFPRAIGGYGPNGLAVYDREPFNPGSPDPSTQGGCGDALCHGKKGNLISINGIEGRTLQDASRDAPWQTLHKIRFGHPGSAMLGTEDTHFPDMTVKTAIDVVSYIQFGINRTAVKGGRLYDDWMAETETAAPGIRHDIFDWGEWWFDPLLVTDADTWRCSVCHWTDFHGVECCLWNDLHWFMSMRKWTYAKLFTSLKEGFGVYDEGFFFVQHNFGAYASDEAIWNLAQFLTQMKGGLNNPYAYVKVLGSFNDYDGGGIADNYERGKRIYNGNANGIIAETGEPYNCVSCHGADGQKIVGTDIFLSSWEDGFRYLLLSRYGRAGVFDMYGVLSMAFLDASGSVQRPGDDTDAADLLAYAQEEFLKRPGAVAIVSQIMQERSLIPPRANGNGR